ncbi:MAG: GNAT family N-acetyltransferase [Rhizobiaceae bacterium]|nr:GNAT family N-acetyltransferase [Rhizobiaceae bacterium]
MIRKFKPEDTEGVVASWRSASELAHPFLTETFLEKEDHDLRNAYLALAETWVCEADGRVVGFIAMIENVIGGLFIDPHYHGRGFGRALVDRALAEKGPLEVEVFRDNAIGRRFYQAYGFQRQSVSLHEPSGQVTILMTFTPASGEEGASVSSTAKPPSAP